MILKGLNDWCYFTCYLNIGVWHAIWSFPLDCKEKGHLSLKTPGKQCSVREQPTFHATHIFASQTSDKNICFCRCWELKWLFMKQTTMYLYVLNQQNTGHRQRTTGCASALFRWYEMFQPYKKTRLRFHITQIFKVEFDRECTIIWKIWLRMQRSLVPLGP